MIFIIILVVVVVVVVGAVTLASVLEPRVVIFVVVFMSIGLSLVAMASDVSSIGVRIGSMSNRPGGMGTTSSSSGSFLVCFGYFPVNFLTGKLRIV